MALILKNTLQRSVQAIAAEAQKRLHMQQSVQNSSFNSSTKGRSPGDRSSPSTPSDSKIGPQGDHGAPGNGDSNNQQDWTFEEQFKQVKIA